MTDNENVEHQPGIPASELPEADSLDEWKDLDEMPPVHVRPANNPPPGVRRKPQSAFGGLIRAIKHIPSCVWVINQHSEEIFVVVSKYKPQRKLSSVGVNASATGGGFNFTTTGPACQKPLPAMVAGAQPSTAVFPLWNRDEAFGVVTIFKGPDKILFIENDRISLGATAYFCNQPDLNIVNYESGNTAVKGAIKSAV